MKRVVAVLLLCFCCSCWLWSQEVVTQEDSTVYYNLLVTPDTLISRIDSVPAPLLADSAVVPVMKTTGFLPDPQKSLWYAIAFPGLGQIYNRKYWKLPIVYGGTMGIVYAIGWNNKTYNEYLIGYRDIMDSNPNTNSYINLLPFGVDPNSEWAKTTLKSRLNQYRRYRDLSILAAVVFYALTVVDAYVDAQLADFDISPDLSMSVSPAVFESPTNSVGEVGVTFGITF